MKRRKRSDEDIRESNANHPDIAIARRTSLRDGEMKVIRMPKGMLKPEHAIIVDRDMATTKENTDAIANPRNWEQTEHGARKDSIPAQSQWVAKLKL